MDVPLHLEFPTAGGDLARLAYVKSKKRFDIHQKMVIRSIDELLMQYTRHKDEKLMAAINEKLSKRLSEFDSEKVFYEYNGNHECNVSISHITDGKLSLGKPSGGGALAFTCYIESVNLTFHVGLVYHEKYEKNFKLHLIPANSYEESTRYNSLNLIHISFALACFERNLADFV